MCLKVFIYNILVRNIAGFQVWQIACLVRIKNVVEMMAMKKSEGGSEGECSIVCICRWLWLRLRLRLHWYVSITWNIWKKVTGKVKTQTQIVIRILIVIPKLKVLEGQTKFLINRKGNNCGVFYFFSANFLLHLWFVLILRESNILVFCFWWTSEVSI